MTRTMLTYGDCLMPIDPLQKVNKVCVSGLCFAESYVLVIGLGKESKRRMGSEEALILVVDTSPA